MNTPLTEMMSKSLDVPGLWCRFCKALTKQWVDSLNTHDRVCIECWRRQDDGERIELRDQPSHPPSAPPPPPPAAPSFWFPEYWSLRDELHDIARRVAALEQAQRIEHVEQGCGGSTR